MKTIGLFYSTETTKTAKVAKKIQEALSDINFTVVPVENSWEKDFEAYDILIVGTSTWFDGELPNYWDELLPRIKSLNLKGKKVALFGLGDQTGYPDNFADGIGILAETFETAGVSIIGQTSSAGYQFNQSKAVRNHKFLGLILDIENQAGKTDERIKNWVQQMKEELL